MRRILEVIVLLVLFAVVNCGGDSAYAANTLLRRAKEYEIKAVYLYNFLLFVDWPEVKTADTEKTPEPNADENVITVGIVGQDPFGHSFAEVEGKLIKSKRKRLVVKRFGRFRKQGDLTGCDLLFVCASERKRFREILAGVKGKAILTVGDTPGFLEAGGMINLVTMGNKIRWEINRTPAKEAQLKMSAQLLRNALRVVEIPKADKEKSTQEGGEK